MADQTTFYFCEKHLSYLYMFATKWAAKSDYSLVRATAWGYNCFIQIDSTGKYELL